MERNRLIRLLQQAFGSEGLSLVNVTQLTDVAALKALSGEGIMTPEFQMLLAGSPSNKVFVGNSFLFGHPARCSTVFFFEKGLMDFTLGDIELVPTH